MTDICLMSLYFEDETEKTYEESPTSRGRSDRDRRRRAWPKNEEPFLMNGRFGGAEATGVIQKRKMIMGKMEIREIGGWEVKGDFINKYKQMFCNIAFHMLKMKKEKVEKCLFHDSGQVYLLARLIKRRETPQYVMRKYFAMPINKEAKRIFASIFRLLDEILRRVSGNNDLKSEPTFVQCLAADEGGVNRGERLSHKPKQWLYSS